MVDFYNVFPLLPGLVAVAVVARISAVRVSSRARQELPESSSGPSFLGKNNNFKLQDFNLQNLVNLNLKVDASNINF